MGIREDLERGAAAMYCAELVDRFTIEHADHPGLYSLLLELLDALEADAPRAVVRSFELQLLSLMGYELQLDACTLCSAALPPIETLLSPSAGGLVCEDCRSRGGAGRVLSVRALKVLRYARAADMAAFASVRIDDDLGFELQRALNEADPLPARPRCPEQPLRRPGRAFGATQPGAASDRSSRRSRGGACDACTRPCTIAESSVGGGVDATVRIFLPAV